MSFFLFVRRLLLVRGPAYFTDSLAPRPVGAFLACSGGNTQLGQKPLRHDYVESDKSDSPNPTRHVSSRVYLLTPSLRRNVIIGHQFVRADWNRFNPTKAVKRYQYALTQYPSAREARMKAPAMSLK
jgi:hypothetical protein